jgi:hypothetical protein
MDSVQRLRFRAYEAGHLRATSTTRVVHTGSNVLIESIEPQTVYIPHYDARVVYGTWWRPRSAPLYWPRWHGYVDPPGRNVFVHWGPGTWLAPGFFFGGFDWPRREVRIVNVHSYYYPARPVDPPVVVHRHVHGHPHAPNLWRHDASRKRIIHDAAAQPKTAPKDTSATARASTVATPTAPAPVRHQPRPVPVAASSAMPQPNHPVHGPRATRTTEPPAAHNAPSKPVTRAATATNAERTVSVTTNTTAEPARRRVRSTSRDRD